MAGKLGILAGGGALPGLIIDACRAAGREVFVVAFDGHADHPAIDAVPHVRARLGAVGVWLTALKDAGVVDLVLAGPVRRPSFKEVMPDLKGAAFLARTGALALGDDGLLSAAVKELEREGFSVVGIDEVTEGLLAAPGCRTARAPSADDVADIARGLAVARGLGALDVGQACVVQRGVVLAVEAVEGTQAMLARCRDLRRDGEGGVLVKAAKPGQERRADLPTIGVATVEQAHAAGLAGVAVEAGASLVLDAGAVMARADELGLFVLGVED